MWAFSAKCDALLMELSAGSAAVQLPSAGSIRCFAKGHFSRRIGVFKGTVKHFGNACFWMIRSTLVCAVNMKLHPAADYLSLDYLSLV